MPDFKHSFNRRCKNHDYKSRCIYMITMLKSPGIPPFSKIYPDPSASKITPIVEISPTGQIIYDCLKQLRIDYPSLRILRSVVMPDHIHLEIFVTARTRRPLGSILAAFKSGCSAKYHENILHSAQCDDKTSMFQPGYNDKIAFRAGSKDAFFNYIADNPRRYLVRKFYPDYFYHKLQIDINGRQCGLYGNLFLLDNPVKSFVKISRNPERTPDYEKKIAEWEETIRCGGVLVSPFINPLEKSYRDKALQNGNSIIVVTDCRFSDRKKPYKELFSQCEEGRLLLISTEQFSDSPKSMEYCHAQELNSIAAYIVRLQPQGAIIKRRQSNPSY